MIILFAILIMMAINASPEYIHSIFKNIDENALQTITNSGAYSFWNELGKIRIFLISFFAIVEGVIEFTLIIKWIPNYIAKQFKKMFNKNNNMDMMNTIDFKIKNGYRLTKKEQRYIDKNKVPNIPKGNNNVS